MKREFIQSYFSKTRDRQAKISKDKYHYVVELFENDKQTKTTLFTIDEHAANIALEGAHSLSQNFVN